jgi:nitrite reductase/ring-hydroxylating ferredoxin subunit
VIDAGRFEDLPPKVPTVRSIGGREIVLVRWDERVYALRNVCPHQSQSFVGGKIHPRVTGSEVPGDIELREDQPVLACPWHTWEFDLATGRCLVDSRLRVAAYTTAVHEGRILVHMNRSKTGQDTP